MYQATLMALTLVVSSASGVVHHRATPPKTDATSTKTKDWACIRQKESGDNYRSGGLEPYGGAYQFAVSTWRSLGFKGLPNQASPATQDRAALALYRWDRKYTGDPWSAWQTAPLCGLS